MGVKKLEEGADGAVRGARPKTIAIFRPRVEAVYEFEGHQDGMPGVLRIIRMADWAALAPEDRPGGVVSCDDRAVMVFTPTASACAPGA